MVVVPDPQYVAGPGVDVDLVLRTLPPQVDRPDQPAVFPPTQPSPSAGVGAAQVLTSAGGSVLARCVDGQVSLDWWTPQQGYRTDDVDRGPGHEARVKFESAAREVELRISCRGGAPVLSTHE